MTQEIPKLVKLIASGWVLSAEASDTGARTMTYSSGILDEALFNLVHSGDAPEWVKHSLRFVQMPVGLRCAQVAGIIAESQSRRLSSAPNPRYSTIQFTLPDETAKDLLATIDVPESEAVRFGKRLRDEIDRSIRRHQPSCGTVA